MATATAIDVPERPQLRINTPPPDPDLEEGVLRERIPRRVPRPRGLSGYIEFPDEMRAEHRTQFRWIAASATVIGIILVYVGNIQGDLGKELLGCAITLIALFSLCISLS